MSFGWDDVGDILLDAAEATINQLQEDDHEASHDVDPYGGSVRDRSGSTVKTGAASKSDDGMMKGLLFLGLGYFGYKAFFEKRRGRR